MIYQSDRVRIDTAAFRVERDGQRCELEPKAFDLLVYLVRHAGRVVTKQEVLDEVWGGVAVTDNALTRVVAQLRRALGDDAREATYIETVPTRGYRWLPPVIEQPVDVVVGAARINPVAEPRIDGVETPVDPADAQVNPAPAGSSQKRATARWLYFAAIAAVALGVIAAGLWWRSVGSAQRPALSFTAAFPVQITTERGLDLFPSVSPNGKAVIYASARSGAFELYVRALERGAADTALTRDGLQNVEPAWSPDGQRVAFHSIARGGVWVMPAFGGSAVQVAAFGSCPSWSPDGRELAFQSDPLGDLGPAALNARPGSTIWSVTADGSTAPRPLTHANRPAGGHASPVWTRDGSHVVFLAQAIGGTEFWSVRADGSSLRKVLSVPGSAFDPVVGDNGRTLVTASGIGLLYTVPIDPGTAAVAGSATAITMALADAVRYPSIAGGHAIFAGFTVESQLLALPVDPATGASTGPARSITNSSARRTTVPAVSPDGEWIAFISGARGAASDLWVTRLDGTGLAQVTTSPEPEARPTWLPDSDALSFLSSRGGVPGIFRTSRTSHHESRLAPRPGGAGGLDDARVSPDGTRVAYSTIEAATGRVELRVRDIASGEDRVIVSGSDAVNFPCWSADGKVIAFEATRDGYAQIGIVAASGGPVRILTGGRAQHWVHSFSPDGSMVASADLDNGVWNIAVTSIADGERRVLTSYTTPTTFVRYPAWSPKGDAIVFEEARLRSNLWSADMPQGR